MRKRTIQFICALIIIGTGACSTRIATPYDSISDDILTQTYTSLTRVKHRVGTDSSRCNSPVQNRDFKRAVVNIDVLEMRYVTRDRVGDVVDSLRALRILVANRTTTRKNGEIVKRCSNKFWTEINRIFETVWIVEQKNVALAPLYLNTYSVFVLREADEKIRT
jgi:hypothetical protein